MIPFQEKHKKVFDKDTLYLVVIENLSVPVPLCIAAAVSYRFFKKLS